MLGISERGQFRRIWKKGRARVFRMLEDDVGSDLERWRAEMLGQVAAGGRERRMTCFSVAGEHFL